MAGRYRGDKVSNVVGKKLLSLIFVVESYFNQFFGDVKAGGNVRALKIIMASTFIL